MKVERKTKYGTMTSASSNISANMSIHQNIDGWHRNANKVLINFITMAVCFSISHGTVVTALSLATSSMPNTVAQVSSGTLYVLYTLTALTFSAALVQKMGGKWSLFLGLMLYCFYVGSFAFARTWPTLIGGSQYPATIIGSTLGGLAAGWIWTAQGAFFARSSMWYAKAKGVPVEEATSFMGGLFATIYVGGELLLKFLSSPIVDEIGFNGLFAVYACVAVIAACLMLFVRDPPLEEGEEEKRQKTTLLRKIFLAIDLLRKSRKMQCLVLLNVAFGFTGTLLNGYCNGELISKGSLGKNNLGYISSITPGVATILSIPYSYLANRIGKCKLMVWGAACFTALACVVWFTPKELLRSMGWWVAILYVLQGSGRAVFENTNKAMVADFFPNDKEGAFSNVIFQSGGAAAFAFFMMAPKWHDTTHLKEIYAAPTAIVSFLAGISLIIAFRIHDKEKQHDSLLTGDDDASDVVIHSEDNEVGGGYDAPEGNKAHGKENWG